MWADRSCGALASSGNDRRYRLPVRTGSIVDLTARVGESATPAEINDAFTATAAPTGEHSHCCRGAFGSTAGRGPLMACWRELANAASNAGARSDRAGSSR
jgi:glyceraldehyde-3-phosphate dehydrogenase/erythrose-4-phosphate dehydrogenase